MTRLHRFPGRGAAFLLLAALTACGKGAAAPKTTTPPPTLLFGEGWAALLLPGAGGSLWTAPVITGGALQVIDTLPADGNPAPSLSVTTAGYPGTYSTTAVPSVAFSAPTITLSANMTASLLNTGTATFQINGTGGALAHADWNAATGGITFTLGGASLGPFGPFGAGVFHDAMLVIDATGTARWFIDGVNTGLTAAWPAGLVTATLVATFVGGAGIPPALLFDNILVTTP